MFNVGGPEFLVILLVALLVLGPDRLPDAVRKVGSFVREFKKISDGFQNEFRDAMEIPSEPIVKPQSPPNLTAVTNEPPSDEDAPTDASPGDEAPPDEEAL